MHLPLIHPFDRAQLHSRAAVGWIAMLISVMAASTYFSLAKDLSGSLSGMSLIFLSELLIFAVSIVTYGLLPTLEHLRRLPHRQRLALAALAVCNGVIAPLLWYVGLRYTLAVNSIFFSKFETIALLIGAHFVLRERMNSSHLLAILSVLAGMILIILRGFSDGLVMQWGDGIILLSGVVYGAGSIFYRRFLADVPAHTIIMSRSIAALLTFLLVAPLFGESLVTSLWNLPAYLVPTLVGFTLIARLLNMVSFYHALERLPVTTVSLVATLDTIGGTIFASFYLGEILEWYHVVGGVFIMLGVLLLELIGTHKNEEHLAVHLRQRAT